jgi:hypothetical protein
MNAVPDRWASGDAYEPYVGRWSRRRVALRDHIRSSLPISPDGSIELTARAWAVRGRRQA